MRTPSQAIAALDRQLAKDWQWLTLIRKNEAGPNTELTVRAQIRPLSSGETTDDAKLAVWEVIISPTSIAGTAFESAPPKTNERASFGGRTYNVETCRPIAMQDRIVRLTVVVKG